MPQVTALLSIYKNDVPEFLDQCIESLHIQTVPIDEVLVVQEGSISKDLEDMMSKWNEIFGERFSWIKVPDQNGPLNYGLPSCLNIGIKEAKFDYIMRMDTDDICEEHRVQVQKKFIEDHPDVALFGSYIQEYNEDFSKALGKRTVPLKHKEIIKYSKWRNPFNGPTVVFKKNIALKLGGFPLIASNEDYCFWANFILNKYQLANIPEVLVKMRGGDGIMVRRSSNRYKKGEIMSLKYLCQTGLYSKKLFLFHYIFRTLIFRNLPFHIIKKIYNSILRND